MDASSVPLLDYGLQYQWCSDSDVSGVSSPETLSPAPSVDSSLSPTRSASKAARTGFPQASRPTACSAPGRGRRSGRAARVRSKQRESASEKEKLRMRDLTKALHHLRSYLPPSVAPTGQTLTKIETLRLTIRYISYLSAQLGLSEEALFRRKERGDTSASDASSPDILGRFPPGAPPPPFRSPDAGLFPAQPAGNCTFGAPRTDSALQSPAATQAPSCQMCGNDFCIPLVPREYWG